MCPGFIFRFLSPKSSFGVPSTPLSRMFDDSAQILLRHGDVWRRGHLAVRLVSWRAHLGAHARHPGGSCRKDFGGLKGGFFQKPPCGGADRLIRYFGCTRPTFRRRLTKSFWGSLRGGFFQKAPFSRLLLAFLFVSFFFAPALSKKKRAWKLIKQWKSNFTSGREDMESSPTNIGFCWAWAPESPSPGGGWRRQAAGGERATKEFVFVLDTARQTLGATTV